MFLPGYAKSGKSVLNFCALDVVEIISKTSGDRSIQTQPVNARDKCEPLTNATKEFGYERYE